MSQPKLKSRFTRGRVSVQRGKLVRRTLAVLKAISQLTLVTVATIRDHLADETVHQVCERTVQRDLDALIDAGLVHIHKVSNRGRQSYKVNSMGWRLPDEAYEPFASEVDEINRRFLEAEAAAYVERTGWDCYEPSQEEIYSRAAELKAMRRERLLDCNGGLSHSGETY